VLTKNLKFSIFCRQNQATLLVNALAFLIIILVLSSHAFSQERPEAYNFSAKDLNGKVRTLDEFNGKVVLLLIWSTNCPICRSEINQFNELARKYKDKDITFIAMSVEPEKRVSDFLRKNPLEYLVLIGGFDAIIGYADIDSDGRFYIAYPTYFLIDKKGRVALKDRGKGKTEKISLVIDKLLTEF
jgi:peroxiredoxin